MKYENLQEAVKFIRDKKLVAFPTETVYGLGADATSEKACQKIFQVKGRPTNNPLIIHVPSLEIAKTLGEFNEDAIKLAEAFWPGALTIVTHLKAGVKIAKSVQAGLKTIAIRVPSHPVAQALLCRAKVPIAAPSANPSGYISPTKLCHVRIHFSNEPDVFVLDVESILPGRVYGLESTIIDCSSTSPIILRDGFITLESCEKALGKLVNRALSSMQIRAPGMMEKHYAPAVPLRMNAIKLHQEELSLNFCDSHLSGDLSLNLSPIGNLTEAAANLYAMLRTLDIYAELSKITGKQAKIAVAPIPNIGIGIAINDRLKRAAKK